MLRGSTKLWPATRTRFSVTSIAIAKRRFAYPKEGVFQPNSPRWNPSTVNSPDGYGYGRQPFPGTAAQSPIPAPTPTTNNGPQQFQPPPPEPPSQSRTGRILRWTWFLARVVLYYSIFAYSFEATLERLPELFSTPFETGSEEDNETLRELLLEYNELHEVNLLRECRYYSAEEGQSMHRFREFPAYRGIPDIGGRRSQRFTTGPLGGSGGVAAQSIFIDEVTGAVCCFINFGEGTCSSDAPGVVHNGLVSTIFDETLGRAAIRTTEQNTAVTANLDVHFLNACKPGQWYCIWARPISGAKSTDKKKYVEALMWCTGPVDETRHTPITHYAGKAPRFEDSVKLAESASSELLVTSGPTIPPLPGTVGIPNASVQFREHPHAYASALFVVPKTVALQEIVEEF